MVYLIYITTNLINGKKYIGSHLTSNINDNYLGSGVILKKAIEKYGKSNFQREILAQLDNIDDMKELEEYYIEYYNAYNSNLFYNATKYAAGITKCTWGDKISKSMMGHTFNLGKTQSQDTKNKISKSNNGKTRSKEFKLNRSKQMLGNTCALGNKLSLETCNLISKNKSKPIIQYSINLDFIKEWPSTIEVSNILKIDGAGISNVLNGKRKTAGGFIWKFKK
jgi:group I intron endonuclease